MITEPLRMLSLSDEEILRIYRDIMPGHFPENELKPLSAIKALLQKNAYIGLGLYGEAADDLAGYALFLKVPGLSTILLDYYAILPEYRNTGTGSIFLEKMKKHFSHINGILLETEAPETASDEAQRVLRRRRNEFYFRNGARMTTVTSSLFGVTFHILYLPLGRELPDEEIQKELEETYHFMLPGESYSRTATVTRSI